MSEGYDISSNESIHSELNGNLTQRMYLDEFDDENERANKPDENPMTLPTIKKRRHTDHNDHFGVYNNMETFCI